MRLDPGYDLGYHVVDREPLIVLMPRDHRLTAHETVSPQDFIGEIFIGGSNKAAVLRAVTEDYLRRSEVDIKLDHGADNMAMAMSLVASTRGLALMPSYAKDFCRGPSSAARWQAGTDDRCSCGLQQTGAARRGDRHRRGAARLAGIPLRRRRCGPVEPGSRRLGTGFTVAGPTGRPALVHLPRFTRSTGTAKPCRGVCRYGRSANTSLHRVRPDARPVRGGPAGAAGTWPTGYDDAAEPYTPAWQEPITGGLLRRPSASPGSWPARRGVRWTFDDHHGRRHRYDVPRN